jgi:hypothetical protein
MARERVSAEDLEAAIEWLEEGYEGDGEIKARLERVAVMLRDEAARRATERAIAKLVKDTGASRAQARRALKQAASK